MKHTADTLYRKILNNPGVSYDELTKGFTKEEWRAFDAAFDKLRFAGRIATVRFTMWSISANTSLRYYPIEKGGLQVVGAIEGDRDIVFDYDPHQTMRKAIEQENHDGETNSQEQR